MQIVSDERVVKEKQLSEVLPLSIAISLEIIVEFHG